MLKKIKDFGGVLLLIAITLSSHAQSKGDNVIEISNTSFDSVVLSFAAHRYVLSSYYPGLAARLTYRKTSPFGEAIVTLDAFKGSDSIIRITGKVNEFDLVYNGTWKKEFMTIAAQAAGSGGKITYTRHSFGPQ